MPLLLTILERTGMPHAWEWHDAYDSLGNYPFAAIEQIFDVRVGPPYNVYRFLNRFLLLLTKLRRQALGLELSISQPRIAGFAV